MLLKASFYSVATVKVRST